MTGIEPALSAWEADGLPLTYTCKMPGAVCRPQAAVFPAVKKGGGENEWGRVSDPHGEMLRFRPAKARTAPCRCVLHPRCRTAFPKPSGNLRLSGVPVKQKERKVLSCRPTGLHRVDSCRHRTPPERGPVFPGCHMEVRNMKKEKSYFIASSAFCKW